MDDKVYRIIRIMEDRKFIAAMFAIIGAHLLVWFEKIDGNIFSLIIIAVMGGFLTSDVVQGFNSNKITLEAMTAQKLAVQESK